MESVLGDFCRILSRISAGTTLATHHEFGGQHTELKLSVVEGYLKAYAQALRPKFRSLWYVDAFAGTGSRTTRTTIGPTLLSPREITLIDTRRGSARIAIDVKPNFDLLVFIEKNPAFVSELNALAARHAQRSIVVAQDDTNAALKSLVSNNTWDDKRAVVFLDPYGMEVEWSTLEALASTKAIDVWFLFPLSGLFRQATRKLTDIDEHKRAALTRMFGCADWEEELYPDGELDLFGNTGERRRELDPQGLERYVKGRLEKIFARVLKPLALPIDSKPQRFSLFLCIANDSPEAIGLATRIGNHLLDRKRHLIVGSAI